MIKFLLKVVILGAAFYGLTYFDVLDGLEVLPNPDGPLGEYGTYLWIGLIFGVVNAIVGPVLRLLSLPFVVLTLGLFLLVGVVMKNAILMIDFALGLERREGLTPEQAIHRAAMLRLRPIVMTNLAGLLGALPLVLGMGEGSELRRPLGVTIVGGLMISQFLTLYTTPIVYLALERLRLKVAGWRARRA